MRFILYANSKIYNCSDCPANRSYPNPLWKRLPPVHKCKDWFEPTDIEGHKLYNPNGIPNGCPWLKE